jgi:hypothetical protein
MAKTGRERTLHTSAMKTGFATLLTVPYQQMERNHKRDVPILSIGKATALTLPAGNRQ